MSTEHVMTVRRLREVLDGLRDDDELIPNEVRNLAVIRDDAFVGYVDFGEAQGLDLSWSAYDEVTA